MKTLKATGSTTLAAVIAAIERNDNLEDDKTVKVLVSPLNDEDGSRVVHFRVKEKDCGDGIILI